MKAYRNGIEITAKKIGTVLISKDGDTDRKGLYVGQYGTEYLLYMRNLIPVVDLLESGYEIEII